MYNWSWKQHHWLVLCAVYLHLNPVKSRVEIMLSAVIMTACHSMILVLYWMPCPWVWSEIFLLACWVDECCKSLLKIQKAWRRSSLKLLKRRGSVVLLARAGVKLATVCNLFLQLSYFYSYTTLRNGWCTLHGSLCHLYLWDCGILIVSLRILSCCMISFWNSETLVRTLMIRLCSLWLSYLCLCSARNPRLCVPSLWLPPRLAISSVCCCG